MFQPFTEEHEQFRKLVRDFAEKELAPHADEWEASLCFPSSVFKRAGELGIHGAHYPEEHGGAGGDYWYSVVKAEEYPRCQSAGVSMGLLVQSDMATPVIGDLGTREQIDEFLKPALSGDRVAALGVSEPAAGSDVAGIKTTARKDGDDYVLNGQKTFITNGTRADFVSPRPIRRSARTAARSFSCRPRPRASACRARSTRSATSPPTPRSSSSRTCASRLAIASATRTRASCT
jgi:citronellyl-CoA dehydrogenase